MLVAMNLGSQVDPYRPILDTESRQLRLSCICDGTLLFAAEMMQIMNILRCSDISFTIEDVAEEDIPKSKPWLRDRFIVTGVLPDTIEITVYNNSNTQ